jgi:ribosomal-protein-serine acetyltransferase
MFEMKIDDNFSIVFIHVNFSRQFFDLYKSNKQQLSQWFNWPSQCKTEDDFEVLITDALIDYAEGKALQCGISHKADLIGYIGLTDIHKTLKKAELNYWISPEFQGRGIMSQVCKKMIDYAFNFLKLEKIEVSIATDNIRSRKICESLGFELEGILKHADSINGNIVDHAKYGLFKHDR